ncbi:hypothetical protein CHUAL_005915 [Chamberlinius hualienensis]
MKLLKPNWISHDGHPIFSIDIHPDGSRLATGGQGEDSGRVVVWNMSSILNEEDEKDENVPKLLCQMDNHLACVNCVRWSNSGNFLASAGDDKVIMVWQTGRYSTTSSVFGSGGSKLEVEKWSCFCTLRGHSGDILDLSWSPNDTWLASCSVDNSIIIWNAQKMPDLVTVLRGHSGLVKGVAWDPIGKYLATQSDDKSLRIWRTIDWHEETVVTEPFTECGGTTHVLRLCWSPDGQYIVSAHAMNNAGPTAQIIERDGWKTEKDFVGHRKAITCVRFNPNILSKESKLSGKIRHYCCCAIGSRDRSLSIWLTALKRPLVVIHDLFTSSVLDVSWSRKGDQIMACSWDGTVASLHFNEDEIGKSLSDDDKNEFYQKMYGKSFVGNSLNTSVSTIIENPALLKLKEAQVNEEKIAPSEKSNGVVVAQAKGPLNRQIETRTADGKRRITPMFISPPPDLGGVPRPFNSRPQPTFSSSTEKQSRIVIEKRQDENSSQNGMGMDGLQSDSSLPPFTTKAVDGVSSGSSDSVKVIQVATPAVPLPVSAKIQTTVNSTETINVNVNQVGDKMKPKMIEAKKEPTPKPALKRGPGRPPLSEKLAHQQAQLQAHQQSIQERDVMSRPSAFHSSDLHLPVLRADKNLNVQIPTGKKDSCIVLELENGISAASDVLVHKLKCSRDNNEGWEVLLPAKGCAVAGSKHIVCVVCDDCSLSIYSSVGRRLQPPLILTSMASRLTCNGYFIMVITSRGWVSVWDVKKQQIVVKNESLLPIMSGSQTDLTITGTNLTDQGCPIVSLSVGRSYIFSLSMGCWMLIHNSDDIIQQCSDHHSCAPSTSELAGGSLPLAALQSQMKRPTQQARRLFRSHSSMQKASTLCHIDNQLMAAASLHSAKEYRFWFLCLTRYLVQEGMEIRLRELCDLLLGTISSSNKNKDKQTDCYVHGIHKHDLLREILPIIGSNLQLQRLYVEYQEQLDLLKS